MTKKKINYNALMRYFRLHMFRMRRLADDLRRCYTYGKSLLVDKRNGTNSRITVPFRFYKRTYERKYDNMVCNCFYLGERCSKKG